MKQSSHAKLGHLLTQRIGNGHKHTTLYRRPADWRECETRGCAVRFTVNDPCTSCGNPTVPLQTDT